MADAKYRDAQSKFYGVKTGNSFDVNAQEFWGQGHQGAKQQTHRAPPQKTLPSPQKLPARTSRNMPMYSPVKVTGAKRMAVEQGILGFNPSTMQIQTSQSSGNRLTTVRRSLGLVPSTDTTKRHFIDFGRESSKIGHFDDSSARRVNDVGYHKHNGLADYTYDSLTGVYREARKRTYF
jgi:hypothetical protein